MTSTCEILKTVNKVGGRLELAGDKIAMFLPQDCPPSLKDDIRENKIMLIRFLEEQHSNLDPYCAPLRSPVSDIQPAQFVPRNPDEFIGPAAKIAKILTRIADRLRTAGNGTTKLLLYGPPGTGKTELAKMLASQLTEHPTSVESINGRNLRIDSVRAWQESARYRPMYGLFNVKIVNELDTVPPESQDLLLTFLDEMPELTAFIGTSNHLGKFEERFRTRLQRFDVNTPNVEQLIELLRRWGLPASTVKQIAVRSKGNVRDALLEAQTFLDGQLVNGAEPKRWR